MVEVHVDLDDTFDARRASLPLGGCFSVRFPGGQRPEDTALTPPPPGLPSPGADLTRVPSSATPLTNAAETSSANDGGRGAGTPQMPTMVQVNKMKVHELKLSLNALGLATDGLKPALRNRLAAAVREASDRAVATTHAADSQGDSDSGDEEWKVKQITQRRVCTHLVDDIAFDVVEYRVRWDWPDEEDPSQDEVTWESEGNLTNAVEALHEFLATQPKADGCQFGHIVGVCRCKAPLIHVGQDESIFKAYQMSQYQWVVQGVRGLRKKTDGPGEMVSGFKDELRGFGHPLTSAELATLNSFRKARGRNPLSTNGVASCTLPELWQEQGGLLDSRAFCGASDRCS